MRRIKRVLGSIDERLPYKEFMDLARKQADAMDLEVIEDGVRYQAVDVKIHIQGHLNVSIADYEEVISHENA